MILRFGISFFILWICLPASCSSLERNRQANEDGYIELESSGKDLDEAVYNAKVSMIDTVLGELVQTESMVLDSGSKGHLVQSSREGFIRKFKVIRQFHENGLIRVEASGFVNKKAIGDALEERYRLLGKPRILVFLSEKIGGISDTSQSRTESKFISFLSGFEIVDSQSIRASKKYLSKIDLEEAKEIAKKQDCELLLFGSLESRDGGPIVSGSSMKAIFATLEYKLIEAESSKILASDTIRGGKPAIDLTYGTEKAREEILPKLASRLKSKLEEEWKRGFSILIEIDGISYDTYSDSDIANRIRSLRGVNFVSEKGKDSSGKIRLTVEALLNGPRLYSNLRELQQDLGISLVGKQIKGNYLRLEASEISRGSSE